MRTNRDNADKNDAFTSSSLLRRHLHPHIIERLSQQLRVSSENEDSWEAQEEQLKETQSLVFIVCLIDALHRSLYATFLSRVLFKNLCNRLLPETVLLQVDFDVYATRWSMAGRNGAVTWKQPIDWDYDGGATHVLLHEISGPVLRGLMTPEQGLQRMEDYFERGKGLSSLERFYRDLPSRIFVIPIMAATCAAVFFDGTWIDFGVAGLLGLMAGLLHLLCSSICPELKSLQDFLISIATGMGAVAAVAIIGRDQSCFSAQLLGTLYWFLVGTAFVLSLYEVTNQQLSVGVMRFFAAFMNSTILAFGGTMGIWFATYGGTNRIDDIVAQECTELNRKQIDDRWFFLLFPLCCIACMMQFKIAPRHWFQCLVVQCAAYLLQYKMTKDWGVPDFAGNFVPAYVATLTAQLVVTIEKRLIRWHRTGKDLNTRIVGLPSLRPLHFDRAPSEHIRNNASAVAGASKLNEAKQNADDPSIGKSGEQVSAADSSDELEDAEPFRDSSKVNNLVAYHNLDLWYCLIPALYLLVPGASLLKETFAAVFNPGHGPQQPEELSNVAAAGDVGSAVLFIGLAQAIGVRCGIVTLRLFRKGWRRWFHNSTSRRNNPGR